MLYSSVHPQPACRNNLCNIKITPILVLIFQTVLEAIDVCTAKLDTLIAENGELTCQEPTDELDELTDPDLSNLKDELKQLNTVVKEQEDVLQEAIIQQVSNGAISVETRWLRRFSDKIKDKECSENDNWCLTMLEFNDSK